MPKFTLVCEHDDNHTVTHEFTEDYLPNVLEHFEYFLKGCGYVFNGVVDVVDEEAMNVICDEECEHNEHYWDINRNRHPDEQLDCFGIAGKGKK